MALERHLKIALGDKFIDLKALPQIMAQRPICYKNWLSFFTSATEPKSVEKIPASLLVDAVFDITGLSGKSGLDADELTARRRPLPDGLRLFCSRSWAWLLQRSRSRRALRSGTTS